MSTNNETPSVARKPARRRKRRRRPRDEPVYYVVEIADWEWNFMFGVSPLKDREGPYSDYRHLQLRGKLLRPAAIKAHEVELSFLPDRRLNEGERERDTPLSVGSLHLHRGSFSGDSVDASRCAALPSVNGHRRSLALRRPDR